MNILSMIIFNYIDDLKLNVLKYILANKDV